MRGSSKPFRLLLPVLLLLSTTSTHLRAGAPGAVAIQFPNIVQPTCGGGSFDTPAFSITRRLGLIVGFGAGSLPLGGLCSGATPPATCAIPPLPDTVCAPAGNGTCVGELQLAPCQLGTPIADRAVGKLCERAVAAGYTVSGTNNAVACAGASCCTQPGTNKTIDINPASCGLRLTYALAAPDTVGMSGLDGLGTGTCIGPSALMAKPAGTGIVDLATQFLFQVQPNGHERVCTGTSLSTCTGNPGVCGKACTTNPAVCTGGTTCTDTKIQIIYAPIGGSDTNLAEVNVASFINDLPGLHNTLAQQLRNATASLNCGVSVDASARASQFRSQYAAGPVVRVANAGATLTKLGVKITQGGFGSESEASSFQVVQETSDFNNTPIPALSVWGVTGLIGAILLSSLWFLRRRRLTAT